ncbi:MAG TPA: tetratricopeptide repeat protein [Polyangia bacterium]|nr:tetratricopeptide repeat protein [Polyangia bacterium]
MRHVLFSLFLTLASLPAAAHAGEAAAAPLSAAQRIAQAKAHFDRGQALFEKAQYGAAALEFQAAYEFQPLALLLWNAAQAYKKSGDNAQAIDYYKRYLEADPKSNKRAEVEKTISDLDFKEKVANAEPPTESAPPPGPPRPQAGDTEAPPFSELALAQAKADRASRKQPPRPWWKDPIAPALLGAGVALAGVGGGLWGAANATVGSASHSYDDFAAAHGVGGQRVAGVVMLSIGAAVAIGGAARYLLVWQRNKDRTESRPVGHRLASRMW